jgi:hypothetical protein
MKLLSSILADPKSFLTCQVKNLDEKKSFFLVWFKKKLFSTSSVENFSFLFFLVYVWEGGVLKNLWFSFFVLGMSSKNEH